METELTTHSIQKPRFLQNKPCGIDKFEGGSQKRLAETIARHFRQNDSSDGKDALPRIIGIEGIWGSGKSNVVKMLEKELSDDYYFFEYDAWGHQEDLQRRSILELLTSELIANDILEGETTIKIKGGAAKNVTWPDKLKYLLARKTETQTEKFPLISHGVVAAFLVAVLTPISTYIAYAIKPTPTSWWFSLLSIVIAALPVIVALCVWAHAYRKNHNKYGLSYLLAIYQDKIEKEVCYETLSEDEPTVYEFKNWMQDISNFIKAKGKQKLVLVFDNMDRLPAEKVKELWSSIHTFFADGGFDCIWAIIPFDETHLACAFGDTEGPQTKLLTRCFINKTFPIVYRVAPPVITDYRNIFDKLFVEAFGFQKPEEQETINRIYRLSNPNANVRDIISFINEMVALKQEWDEAISMINIALFCLKKKTIIKKPVEEILSGNYLESFKSIINNDIQTQSEIAALTYGVDIEHAKQIPLKKYIERCISKESGYDINQYAETNKQFDTVLDETIKDTDDILINNIIDCLSDLKRNNDTILRLWQYIAHIKLKENITEQTFPIEYKKLILRLPQEEQNLVLSKLYKKIVLFPEFNGAKYFYTLKEISDFITQNRLSCDLASFIEIKEVEPSVFIEYIRAANKTPNDTSYKTYQVVTNAESLDKYLSEQLPDNFAYTDILETLKNDSAYTFSTLLESIKSNIKTSNVVHKDNVGSLFSAYRVLAPNDERPLSVTMPPNLIQQLHSELTTSQKDITLSGYYDLVAMLLAHGYAISLKEGDEIKHIAEIIDYYANHEKLLLYCIEVSNPLLNNTIKYMVENKLGNKLSPEKILPKFESIRKRINVTEDAFIEHLSTWCTDWNTAITKENIKSVIPTASLFGLTVRIHTPLTEHINKMAIAALSDIDTTSLYSQRGNSSDYWISAITHLIDLITSLPDNLTDFGKKIMSDIASGSQDMTQIPDYINKILQQLDTKKIITTITDIRNAFCNGQKSINPAIFQFFEAWFREIARLQDRTEDVVAKILTPVISDPACRTLILQNSEFYIQLIMAAGDSAYELKEKIRTIPQSETDEPLNAFGNSIGIIQGTK